jgi:hypothetical protein
MSLNLGMLRVIYKSQKAKGNNRKEWESAVKEAKVFRPWSQ